MNLGLVAQLAGLKPEQINRQALDFAEASADAVEEATTRTKERGRAQLRVGFPRSRRVATILRGDFFPARGDKPPAGYVYSAWFKRGHDILAAFATGGTIAAPDGGRLLVPADDSPGGKAMARAGLEALGTGPRIGIVRTKAGKLLLVERLDKLTRILGFLVKSVRMPKRFDAAGLAPFGEALLARRMLENLQAKGF